MENTVDIYNLLPEEINEVIRKLTTALEIVKCRKNTNSKFVDKEKEIIICPHCQSKRIIKNGHDKNKIQTYYCKDCSKKFSPCTNTPLARIKLTYEQLVTFFECMTDKLSIKKTAAKMGCNKNTVFLLRHKVLDSISKIRKATKLKEKVEADETYESINLKGTKPKNMPRASKPRSSKGGSKRGISNHQVCIASAIDEYDNCFLEIVGTGPITSEQVISVFNDKIESGYSLGNINSLHSELATFLSHFKGVSTKHLQHYLDWFCFQKLINYTTEILKQPLTMMKKATVNSCTVNSSNVYNNTSGIDFYKVYSDYNFSPLTN